MNVIKWEIIRNNENEIVEYKSVVNNYSWKIERSVAIGLGTVYEVNGYLFESLKQAKNFVSSKAGA